MNNITKKLNQRQLAQKVGVTDSYISHILNGKREPSFAMAQRLAKALGMGLDRFLLVLRSLQKTRQDKIAKRSKIVLDTESTFCQDVSDMKIPELF